MQIKIGDFLESSFHRGLAIKVKKQTPDRVTGDWYRKENGKWISLGVEQEIVINEMFDKEWHKINLN